MDSEYGTETPLKQIFEENGLPKSGINGAPDFIQVLSFFEPTIRQLGFTLADGASDPAAAFVKTG